MASEGAKHPKPDTVYGECMSGNLHDDRFDKLQDIIDNERPGRFLIPVLHEAQQLLGVCPKMFIFVARPGYS